MKYTLFGFSQEKAVGLGLGLEELAILRYLVDFAPNMKKMESTSDGVTVYWVNYASFMEEFPIMGIKSKDSFYRRMQKLTNSGVLTHFTLKQEGTWSYYGFGEKYAELLTDTPCRKNAAPPAANLQDPLPQKCGNKEPSTNKQFTKLNNGFDSDGNKPIGIDSKDNSIKAQAIKVLEDYIYSTLVTSLRHSEKRPARKSAEVIATSMMLYYAPDGGDWYRGKGNKRVSISSWKRCCATFVNNAIAQNKIEFEETFIPLEQRARKVQ